MDSTSEAEAVWPELAELKGTHFHDTLMSRRVARSDSAADSLYRTDVRVLQHILFGARNAPPPVKEATRKKAGATLVRVRKGADFIRLASELSEDPGSKTDSFIKAVKVPVHVPLSGKTMEFDAAGKCAAGCTAGG